MPTLTVETVRTDSVTLIEAVLETERPLSVRLETCFDGPVWPPRRDGTPVDGWDGDGVTIETEGEATAIGFATPVAATDRPLEIVASEPRDGTVAGIEQWLERIEGRLEMAESFATVDDLDSAADAIAAAGGLAAVETLASEIARDRRLAGRISPVPDRLRERLEAVEIPTAAFATLADATRS